MSPANHVSFAPPNAIAAVIVSGEVPAVPVDATTPWLLRADAPVS
jgi:hypothetical protein